MPLGMSGHMCTHTVCAPLAASSVGSETGAACPVRSTFPHLFSFLAWLWQRTSCLGFAASSHLPALAACAESCPRAPLLVETHAAVPAPGATSVTVRPSGVGSAQQFGLRSCHFPFHPTQTPLQFLCLHLLKLCFAPNCRHDPFLRQQHPFWSNHSLLLGAGFGGQTADVFVPLSFHAGSSFRKPKPSHSCSE